MPIDNMDKFDVKKIKNIKPIKNSWYDWLINYIHESIRKSAGVSKYKIGKSF